MAVFNINTFLTSLNFFLIITPYVSVVILSPTSLTFHSIYSFSLFLPTIISGLGYTRVTAQLFTVPPNMVGFFSVLLGTYASDRFKARGPIMIVGCSLAIVGYIMLVAAQRPAVRYGGFVFSPS